MGRSDSGKSLIWALCLLVLDMAVIVHRLALRGGSPMVPQLVADGWAAGQVGAGMIMIRRNASTIAAAQGQWPGSRSRRRRPLRAIRAGMCAAADGRRVMKWPIVWP